MRRTTRILLGAFTVLSGTSISTIAAQSAPKSGATATLPPDTTIIRLIAPAVIGELGYQFMRVVLDRPTRPLEVTIPDSASAPWGAFASALRQTLRTRAPNALDRSYEFVSIAPPMMTADTLAIEFFVGGRSRCPRVTTSAGSVVAFTVIARRTRNGWVEGAKIVGDRGHSVC